LISACDGSIDEAERDAIRRASAVLGATEPELDADNLLQRALALAHSERIELELERVGAELGAAGVAREAVVTAAVVGLVSQGMSLGELEALRRLAVAAGFEESAIGPLSDVSDATLGS
jgi:hypothetical protein